MTELLDEVRRELFECARYGEEEDLLSLIQQYQANVNSQDQQGNTALHKAAANGHVKCLEILHQYGAKHIKNHEGNYPIHWAAQNGQAEALRFLFAHYDVDVLEQNQSGRSTLTDAFQSGKTEAIEICLSHESATEERLIPGDSPATTTSVGHGASANVESKDNNNEEEDCGNVRTDQSTKNETTHRMKLTESDEVLLIRELPITRADNPFGSEDAPEDDSTGLGIWPASILLSRWVAQLGSSYFEDKTVLELGAGCGLPALSSAIYCSPKKVFISDIHEPTLQNAKHNILINTRQNANQAEEISDFVRVDHVSGHETVISLRNINWKDVSTFPTERADVLLGSDLVYDVNILSILIPAIPLMLKPEGEFLYVAPNTGRDG